jgi:hypothetical protein
MALPWDQSSGRQQNPLRRPRVAGRKNGAGSRRSTVVVALGRQTRGMECPLVNPCFRARETGNLDPKIACVRVSATCLRYPAIVFYDLNIFTVSAEVLHSFENRKTTTIILRVRTIYRAARDALRLRLEPLRSLIVPREMAEWASIA